MNLPEAYCATGKRATIADIFSVSKWQALDNTYSQRLSLGVGAVVGRYAITFKSTFKNCQNYNQVCRYKVKAN